MYAIRSYYADKFFLYPINPVAQNLQSRGQPTWVERQSVVRSSSGIITDSILEPSRVSNKNLVVPLLGDAVFLTNLSVLIGPVISDNFVRSTFGSYNFV